MATIKHIGVLTSGGDAPGMNAAIRAVTRTGTYHGIEVTGIYRGYQGMIEGEFHLNLKKSVSNIIQRGGTILKTARSEEFKTKEGREKAHRQIQKLEIDALVVIGGDGSLRGALEFSREYDIPVIGLPGTIDNDMYGTDSTIGYDTALNTVVQAVDKIRDTAGSHNRLFFIEVMGRDAGFIAINSGIAVGAEDILIPETETHIDELIKWLQHERRVNKTSGIIIVAEGDDAGGAYEIARKVEDHFHEYETKVTILGHIQRGGPPSCSDRVLASRMGYEAVKHLLNGERSKMVGIVNNRFVLTSLEKTGKRVHKIDNELLKMARVLSS